jgi:hypothetical protein
MTHVSAARALWMRIETLHAVTYFAPESLDAAKHAGLRGFWMGYFGFRAAPLGRVQPGVVDAAFANFAPAMVRRSIPDAWAYADPDRLVVVRADAAATALRRLAPTIDAVSAAVNDRLGRIVELADTIARPLFAGNRALDPFDDPVAELWQLCTTLREHRGDGHVLSLAAAGIDGCEAHQLLIADHGHPAETFRDNRGWSDDVWASAADRLRRRRLLDGDVLTDEGRRVRADVESATDQLAVEPVLRALDTSAFADLISELTPAAVAVVDSGVLPYPNPMGLPPVTT